MKAAVYASYAMMLALPIIVGIGAWSAYHASISPRPTLEQVQAQERAEEARMTPAEREANKELEDSVDPNAKPDWYIADSTFTSCIKANSPADQIATLRQGGGEATASEKRDEYGKLLSVEVSTPSGSLATRYWTYYASRPICLAGLDARNRIPDDYK